MEEEYLFAEKPKLKTLFIHKKDVILHKRRSSDISSLQNSSLKESDSIVFNRLPSNFIDALQKRSQMPYKSVK